MLTFKWIVGDITKDKVDVIVNAANSGLLGGGGVDGAIHKAAGPRLKKECQALRDGAEYREGLGTGEVVATWAYNLPAQMVFHTVGPIYDPENINCHYDPAAELRSCYVQCIYKALDRNVKSIAFPAISTGVYCYPKDGAAKIVKSAMAIFRDAKKNLEVRFYFMTQKDLEIHKNAFMSS